MSVVGDFPLPLVSVRAAAAEVMRAEAERSADGKETGGILLGRMSAGGAEVHHVGGPGPAAVRMPSFFLRDLGYAQQLAHDTFHDDGSLWIGEWHTHLASPAAPSPRDLATSLGLLADVQLGFTIFLAIIVVPGMGGWAQPIARAWVCSPSGGEAVPMIVGAAS